MRYRDLSILTLREAPNNARTEGFAFLVRAGFLTHENDPTELGKFALDHLEKLAAKTGGSFFAEIHLPVIGNNEETFFPIPTGATEVIHCPACGYTSRSEAALFAKSALPGEAPLPLEKVATPDCNTIESLANFLNIPKEKTAKALLYTRPSDGKFIFAVVRGDMALSEAKLKRQVGEVRPATAEEIEQAGAVPGYASPVGLADALVIVDDLVPQSANLVAGANDPGHHLKNVNYGRDYRAEIVADLVQARGGDACAECGNPLKELPADVLEDGAGYRFDKLLLALAESHHDPNGLTIPRPAAPFDVYLMPIPGKELDTFAAADEIYRSLQAAGLTVLFDDRDERAGVKFNDADLIGPPLRVTVGERGLKEGVVELKRRDSSEKGLVPIEILSEMVRN
ncbi:MAG: YbaK/EbsC family protein [Chloroflexota bacterium]